MTENDIEIVLTGTHDDTTESVPQKLVVNAEDEEEDRYSRLRLISWWDQELLKNARVMVVGAGAIGNELLKNLTMLGVGNIYVVDIDSIENSNLSRSILFRLSDEGRLKAQVAAERMQEINPDIKVQWSKENIVYDVGLGVFRAMDVVLGGLDNREARLAINQACWKVNRPWIDGGIEVMNGIARVFVPPHSACYECTMNEMDFKLLEMRRSCALLTRDEMAAGKVPTTPTTASVIGGIQVQEMLKLLHARRDLPILEGKGFYFNGLTHDSFVVNYPRKEFCMSHDTFENIEETDFSARTTTIREALALVKDRLGENAVLDFGRDMIVSLSCGACNKTQAIFKQMGQVTEAEGRCVDCGEMRSPEIIHSVTGDENFLDLTLTEAGVPIFDILIGRNGQEALYFELTGDRQEALGQIV